MGHIYIYIYGLALGCVLKYTSAESARRYTFEARNYTLKLKPQTETAR